MRTICFCVTFLYFSALHSYTAPPQVSQVLVNQDSIGFNIAVTGQDTLRIWTGSVTFSLFDPDSDWCRITLETNKPNAGVASCWGDTLATNGHGNKVYFTITANEPLGYDVQLKVIANDSLPYIGTISGLTVLPDGFPAEYTRVILLPYTFNPVEGDSILPTDIDTTGEDGIYTIKGVSTGVYNMYGLGFINFARTLIPSIEYHGQDSIIISDAVLKIPGKIKVSSNVLPAYTPDLYLYLPGTLNYELIDSLQYVNDQIVIDSVPEGTIPLINYSVKGSGISTTIAEGVMVISKDTTYIQ